MQKSALPRQAPDPVLIAGLAIAAITLYRVALLPFATADLFVDEAQYWQWWQELDWGYYSKPPLIGWVIRAVTDLAGSDAAFWVRVPGPLLHALTGLIVIGAARQVAGAAPAAMVGLAYVSMPAVALGSLLFSTDTLLMPCFAAATWIYLRLAQRASVLGAAFLGLVLGLGMLAKYAAIYFPLCAVLAAVCLPSARIRWRDVAIAAGVWALVIAPNVIWNLRNDLTTLSHTADNIDWVRGDGLRLNLSGAAEFVLSQLAVMGPVLFLAYLGIAARSLRCAGWQRLWLLWMSLPILTLVTLQALLSRAYANWAVTAYVAALMLTIPVLWQRARWLLWLGLAVNLALVAALPFAATRATVWTIGAADRLVLARYTGRAALSLYAMEVARGEGITDLVSDNRDVLADLFYTARDSGFAIFAKPAPGRPPHFYAQRHPYPKDRPGAALFVSFSAVSPCSGAVPVAQWQAGPGAYAGRTLTLYRIGGACWPAE